MGQTLYHTIKRYRSLHSDKISVLPVVILMPHSACNCKCVMCDIWKGNQNLRQLTESDITSLLRTFIKFETQQVLMSGGEALLNPNFFKFCALLKKENISVSLLSSGLLLKRYAVQLAEGVHDIIVSLDGDKVTHDAIRNIPGAFNKIAEGIEAIRQIDPGYRITGRCVIHKHNFAIWPLIIDNAKRIGLDQISFLPADVSSSAFNREELWNETRQHEILLSKNEIYELRLVLDNILINYQDDFSNNFIAESPIKIEKIYQYYAAIHKMNPFPYKKCNAPWVSTVIEADGTVRPCFFHKSYGNIKMNTLDNIINSEEAIHFRKNLDMQKNEICRKCVCYLNLRPGMRV